MLAASEGLFRAAAVGMGREEREEGMMLYGLCCGCCCDAVVDV